MKERKLYSLQYRHFRERVRDGTLQRGRSHEGAETSTVIRNQPRYGGFNGAAPMKERKLGVVITPGVDERSFNGAAPMKERKQDER